jgi:hypothetical protein
MSEPILPRELIAEQARSAVRQSAATGAEPANPYPVDSDAFRLFACYVKRWTHADVPDAESTA